MTEAVLSTMGAEAVDGVPEDVGDLIRTLVLALRAWRSPGGDGATTPVMLDVECDDLRLLVVRQGCPSPMSLLSPREREIARMAARGYPNKAIASVLEISTWTVASHLRRIFMKLQVSSRAAMATRLSTDALPEGLPDPLVRPGEDDYELIDAAP